MTREIAGRCAEVAEGCERVAVRIVDGEQFPGGHMWRSVMGPDGKREWQPSCSLGQVEAEVDGMATMAKLLRAMIKAGLTESVARLDKLTRVVAAANDSQQWGTVVQYLRALASEFRALSHAPIAPVSALVQDHGAMQSAIWGVYMPSVEAWVLSDQMNAEPAHVTAKITLDEAKMWTTKPSSGSPWTYYVTAIDEVMSQPMPAPVEEPAPAKVEERELELVPA